MNPSRPAPMCFALLWYCFFKKIIIFSIWLVYSVLSNFFFCCLFNYFLFAKLTLEISNCTNVQQSDPITHIYTFFLSHYLSSIMFHHKWLDIVHCAIQQSLIVYPLQMQQFASINPKLPVHPSFPHGNHKSVLQVHELVYLCHILNSRYKW